MITINRCRYRKQLLGKLTQKGQQARIQFTLRALFEEALINITSCRLKVFPPLGAPLRFIVDGNRSCSRRKSVRCVYASMYIVAVLGLVLMKFLYNKQYVIQEHPAWLRSSIKYCTGRCSCFRCVRAAAEPPIFCCSLLCRVISPL